MRARTESDSRSAWQALSRLCEDYWYPLYAYARRRGFSPEDAQDLTQSFFAQVIEKNLFAAAEPQLGKLRTFLLTAFDRRIADQQRRASREKRGGECEFVSLDDGESRYAEESLAIASPAKLFEHAWAYRVLEMALRQLGSEEAAEGRSDAFKVLEPFLSPACTERADYQTAAEQLGISVDSARHAVQRLRKRFRHVLRQQIADTLTNPSEAEIDQEIAALRKALAE